MNDAEVCDAMADALGSSPLSVGELVAAIGDPTIDEADIEDAALGDARFLETTNGYSFLPAVAEGVELTFPVDAESETGGALVLPRFVGEIVSWLVLGGATSSGADGEELDRSLDIRQVDGVARDVVVGPSGWLPSEASGWVSATASDGRLQLRPIAGPPEPTGEQIAAVRAAFERSASTVVADLPGQPEPTELRFAPAGLPFDEALTAHPEVFRGGPVPPLDDLYTKAELDVFRDTVAESGMDWEAFIGWRSWHDLSETHQLSESHTDGLMGLIGATMLVGEGNPDALGTDEREREGAALLLAGLLGIGDVAQAFWWELEERGELGSLGPFAAALDEHLGDGPAVGLSWLRARVAERSGESVAAYDDLVAAVEANSDHGPAFRDLALYETDRGDLGRAHDLLRLAGAADDPLLGEHEQALLDEVDAYRNVKPDKPIGRNDPCPCGSGRKYKACHLKAGFLDFDHRAAWLHDKIIRYGLQHGEVEYQELLDAVPRSSFDDEDAHAWVHGPVGLDLVCWEGGVAERFAAARSPLLPEDEAALLEPWLAARRSVFEVQKAADGTLHLHDIVNERDCLIDNVDPSAAIERGLVVILRPSPVGPINRSFTPMIPIDPTLASAACDAVATHDLATIAACYAEVFGRLRVAS